MGKIRSSDVVEAEIPLNEHQHALYILTERQLIGYLTERMMLLDRSMDRLKCELEMAVIVSSVYEGWFRNQIDEVNQEKFMKLYRGTRGPSNLFRALFPGQEIDDFLKKHLQTKPEELPEEADTASQIRIKIFAAVEVSDDDCECAAEA